MSYLGEAQKSLHNKHGVGAVLCGNLARILGVSWGPPLLAYTFAGTVRCASSRCQTSLIFRLLLSLSRGSYCFPKALKLRHPIPEGDKGTAPDLYSFFWAITWLPNDRLSMDIKSYTAEAVGPFHD